jgi:hypothetical protein
MREARSRESERRERFGFFLSFFPFFVCLPCFFGTCQQRHTTGGWGNQRIGSGEGGFGWGKSEGVQDGWWWRRRRVGSKIR